jgi:histidinol-phosphate aminotransferase
MSAPQPRPEVFSVDPYVGGESKLPGGGRVIKLSSNEGAFGPPPEAIAAMQAAAATMHRYPDGGMAALRAAIGERFGIDPARIVCGNGSDELIALLVQAYGGPGTELLTTELSFSIYEIAGKVAGCTVVKAPERGLAADVDALLARVTARTKLVFLANPNNPTGTLIAGGELARLRAGLPEDVLLVLDGAYAEYVDHADYDAGRALVEAGENTVMTRTFSKIFGLGGARVGWAYGPAAVVDVLNRMRPPFNVNETAAAGAIAALAAPGWVEKGREHNAQARRRLAERLAQAGIDVHPSAANFLLADFGTAARAAAADAHLRSQGILVRHVKSYGLPQCLRITVGTDEECGAVAAALADFAHG